MNINHSGQIINEYEAINHGMKALQIIITNRNKNIQSVY